MDDYYSGDEYDAPAAGGGSAAAAAAAAAASRASRACLTCRRLKSRCTGDGTSACPACTRKGVECVYAEPRKRGPKPMSALAALTSGIGGPSQPHYGAGGHGVPSPVVVSHAFPPPQRAAAAAAAAGGVPAAAAAASNLGLLLAATSSSSSSSSSSALSTAAAAGAPPAAKRRRPAPPGAVDATGGGSSETSSLSEADGGGQYPLPYPHYQQAQQHQRGAAHHAYVQQQQQQQAWYGQQQQQQQQAAAGTPPSMALPPQQPPSSSAAAAAAAAAGEPPPVGSVEEEVRWFRVFFLYANSQLHTVCKTEFYFNLLKLRRFPVLLAILGTRRPLCDHAHGKCAEQGSVPLPPDEAAAAAATAAAAELLSGDNDQAAVVARMESALVNGMPAAGYSAAPDLAARHLAQLPERHRTPEANSRPALLSAEAMHYGMLALGARMDGAHAAGDEYAARCRALVHECWDPDGGVGYDDFTGVNLVSALLLLAYYSIGMLTSPLTLADQRRPALYVTMAASLAEGLEVDDGGVPAGTATTTTSSASNSANGTPVVGPLGRSNSSSSGGGSASSSSSAAAVAAARSVVDQAALLAPGSARLTPTLLTTLSSMLELMAMMRRLALDAALQGSALHPVPHLPGIPPAPPAAAAASSAAPPPPQPQPPAHQPQYGSPYDVLSAPVAVTTAAPVGGAASSSSSAAASASTVLLPPLAANPESAGGLGWRGKGPSGWAQRMEGPAYDTPRARVTRLLSAVNSRTRAGLAASEELRQQAPALLAALDEAAAIAVKHGLYGHIGFVIAASTEAARCSLLYACGDVNAAMCAAERAIAAMSNPLRRYANYVNAGQLLQVMPCLALFRRRDLAMQVLAIMRDVAAVWPMGLAAMRGAQRRYAQLAVLEAPSAAEPAWHAPAPPSYSLGGGSGSGGGAAPAAGAALSGQLQGQPRAPPQASTFGAMPPRAPGGAVAFPAATTAAPATAVSTAPSAAAHPPPPAAGAAASGGVPRHRAASSASVFELGPSDFFPLGLGTHGGAPGGGGAGAGRGGGFGPGAGVPPAGGSGGMLHGGMYGGGGAGAGAGGAGFVYPRSGAGKAFPPLPLGGGGSAALPGGGGAGGRMRVPSFDLPGDDSDLLRAGSGMDSARLSVVAATAMAPHGGRNVLDSPVPGAPVAPRGGPGGGSGGYSSVLQSPARVSDDVLEAAFWAT